MSGHDQTPETARNEAAPVRELLDSTPICLVTTVREDGTLVAHPMTRRDDDQSDAALTFIAGADSDLVADVTRLAGQAGADRPGAPVGVTVQSSKGFASVSGFARIDDDAGALARLWSDSVGAWFDGGPEDSRAVLVRVDADSAQYWTTESRVGTVVELVKAKVTGERPDAGESGTVDL
ncbi:pyridoxamine 5'-phosphate oxidase family protein [Corynebacterium sp. 335C]